MKTWNTRNEWISLALCHDDPRFTAEQLAPTDVQEVEEICRRCPVRVECMKTCLEERWSSVVVAGIVLPDPSNTGALRRVYRRFRAALPMELESRGEI